MKRLEYIHSPEYMTLDAIRYRYSKVFQFEYETDKLRTKGKKKNKNRIYQNEKNDFQKQLLEAKRIQNRRVFKSDVVLQMDIYVNQKNAPFIQNIPKHYIDLLWRPEAKFKNKKLILNEDDQIKYLIVNYKKSNLDKSKLSIKIFPYYRFLKDIEVLMRLRSGTFKHEFRRSKLADEQRDENKHVGKRYIDYADALGEHLKGKDEYIAEYGESNFEFWENYHLQNYQRSRLINKRIKNNDILDLFESSIVIDNEIMNNLEDDNHIFPNIDFKDTSDIEDLRNMLLDVKVDFNINGLPIREGQGKLFKNELKNKVDEYFDENKFFAPMLVPIALSIFILPRKNHLKDFDNIAKWILPLYMKKLNPPTSLTELSISHEKEKQNLPRCVTRYFPKNAIMSYQIIEVPRSEKSPENGYIKVSFHNVDYYSSFADYVINQINKYADEL